MVPDALRFTVLYLAPLGQDVLFSADRCDLEETTKTKFGMPKIFIDER
ncbi:MAG: hypothetical protein U5J96_12270 [Ignavibacteriaceae bacterium]|nr:hypothetical protein [Ignavibacteriaceae bacterium]